MRICSFVTVSIILISLSVPETHAAQNHLRVVVLPGDTAAGMPVGVTISGYLPPGINEDGFVSFVGSAANFSRNGIWIEDESGLKTLVLEQNPVSSAGVLDFFYNYPQPLVNELGQVVFVGEFSGPHPQPDRIFKASAGEGVQVLVQPGDDAPGIPSEEAKFTGVDDPVMNNIGEVAFTASVQGYVQGVEDDISFHDDTVWLANASDGLQLIAREDQPVVSPDMKFGGSFSHPKLNDRGEVFFASILKSPGYRGIGLIKHDPVSGIKVIAKEGDPAPGFSEGTESASLSDLQSQNYLPNGQGEVIFTGDITGVGINAANNYGIWKGSNSSDLELLIQKGQSISYESESKWYSFSPLRLNNRGEVLIHGRVTQEEIDPVTGRAEESTEGLWISDQLNGDRLIALRGQRAPGTPDGIAFDDFSEINAPPNASIDDSGQVVFFSRLGGPELNHLNDGSFWVLDRRGQLRMIVREGDFIDIDRGPEVDLRQIRQLSACIDLGCGLNSHGQFAFLASYGNDASAIVVTDLGIIPEPSSLVHILAGAIFCAAACRRSKFLKQ